MTSLNTIYALANITALSGWVILLTSLFLNIKVPFIAARIIPAALAVCYTALMLSILPFKGGGFASLSGLASLFAQPQIALVGWIHYLCFDLFVGAWQVQTAKRQQLPNILVVPSLILTMLLGPLGLLVFLCARYAFQNRQQESQTGLNANLDSNGPPG